MASLTGAGGTGLVGEAIRYVVENEPVGSKFGKQSADEQWVFLSSKDGDLRDFKATKAIFDKYQPTHGPSTSPEAC